MSVYIPVRNGGIDPVEYLRPYYGNLTDREISILVGSVIFLRNIKYKTLSNLLNLKKIEVEEKLGRVMQTDFWEGEFSRTSFSLSKLNYNIRQQELDLDMNEKTILAYLKARYIVTIEELEKSFSLNFESVIHYLSVFTTKGLISSEYNEENQSFSVIVYYKMERKEAEDVTDLEKMIVGYVRLKEKTNIKNISKDLEVPEHQIQHGLIEMILSDLILCVFDVAIARFGSLDVQVMIKNFLIEFQHRTLEMMNPTEKLIIGLSCLQKGVTLSDLKHVLNMNITEIIKIISKLNGTREFEFRLNEKEQIIAVTVPVFDVNTSIDDIDRNSVINYKSLLGLVKAKHKLTIFEISDRMKISNINVVKGLIDLYLNGFIMGSLSNLKTFKLETMRTISQEYVTFEDWEKVIIGGLLSEGKLSMAKLGALLNLNKTQTQERALAFISRNVGDPEITNAFLSLRKKLKIPPLTQILELDLIDQQIFCYLTTNIEVNMKKLKSLFELKNSQIYRRIYFLVGSGLLEIESNKQQIIVKSFYKNTPIDGIETLDHDLRMLIYYIEKENKKKIRMSSLASQLNWSIDEVNLDFSYLVGVGYYKGYIKGRYLYLESGLFKFKDKPKCFECNAILNNFREPCPNCFARPPQCSVCRSKMNSSESILVCPHCSNSAHSNHIGEWLKIKGVCPMCRNRLVLNQMNPLVQS